MTTEHTFETEEQAQVACRELNDIGSQRNKGSVVAFRVGRKVWIRPEFRSKYICGALSDLTESFGAFGLD